MDHLKIAEEISEHGDARVELVKRSFKNLSFPFVSQQEDNLRRKTIRFQNSPQSEFTRIRIQQNLEKLRNSTLSEYSSSLSWAFKHDDLVIEQHFIEGQTLDKMLVKEEKLKPHEVVRLQGKLLLWGQIFEKLAQFHKAGVLHGNLKPANILISDTLNPEWHQERSLFLEQLAQGEGMHFVSLLDGGYQHLLEINREMGGQEAQQSTKHGDVFWQSPEARGFIEGIYGEASDIFSLSAIMAWDLGMLDLETKLSSSSFQEMKEIFKTSSLELEHLDHAHGKHSIVQNLWSILFVPEDNSFYFGWQWYRTSVRNIMTDVLRKVRHMLIKALEPLPENRTLPAKEMASSLLNLAKRLTEIRDPAHFNSGCEPYSLRLAQDYNDNIFRNFFHIPQEITNFILNKQNDKKTNRLWIEAKNRQADKQQLLRKIGSAFHTTGVHAFCFRIRIAESEFPFISLNRFFDEFISYTRFLNPHIIEILEQHIVGLGVQREFLFQVLPSLRRYFPKFRAKNDNIKEFSTYSKHEFLHKNFQNLVDKITKYSDISVIIIDDIQRADISSLPVFLTIVENSATLKWIIGMRDEEVAKNEEFHRQFANVERTLTFSALDEGRTNTWIPRLNRLPSQNARFLGVLAAYPSALTPETISYLAQKSCSTPGIISSSYYAGKSSEKNRKILEEEDFIGAENGEEEKITAQEFKIEDPVLFAADTLKLSADIGGILVESRDPATGRLISYYWDNQTIWMGLSLVLNKEMTSHVFDAIIQHSFAGINENWGWREYIIFSDILLKSTKVQNIYAAYFVLRAAIDKINDIHSVGFLIKKFQQLEEQIEIRRLPEAHSMIPCIRENIADLAKSLSDAPTARKYYQSILWNKVSPFTKVAIEMKALFFSHMVHQNERNNSFFNILNHVEECGFLGKFRKIEREKYLKILGSQIERINSVFRYNNDAFSYEKMSFDNENLRIILQENNHSNFRKSIIKTVSYEDKGSRIQVFAEFLRRSLGWIKRENLIAPLLNALDIAIGNRNGEQIVHLCFSIILAFERDIPSSLRNKIFDVLDKIASRNKNELALHELQLLKAWNQIFFDGNLVESKKLIDILTGSFYEFPKNLRQAVGKLNIILDYELNAFAKIKNLKAAKVKLVASLKMFDLLDWHLGKIIYNFEGNSAIEEPCRDDETQVAHILREKTDQFLQANFSPILQDREETFELMTSEKPHRFSFVEEEESLQYLPENILQNLAKSGEEALRFDRYSILDGEKTFRFVRALSECHFYWMAYRLCQRSRLDFSGTLASMLGREFIEQEELRSVQQERTQPGGTGGNNGSEGVAIGYLLEFVMNFRDKAILNHQGDYSASQLVELLQASVPHSFSSAHPLEQSLDAALTRALGRLEEKLGETHLQNGPEATTPPSDSAPLAAVQSLPKEGAEEKESFKKLTIING